MRRSRAGRGKVVPIVAYEIAQGIEAGEEPLLNLKGYLLGNGFTGEKIDLASLPYAYGAGIISHELYRETVRHCKGEDYSDPSNPLCAKNLNAVNKLLSDINVGDLQRAMCPTDEVLHSRRSLMQKKITEVINPPPLPAGLYCRSYAYFQLYYWANNESTRDAMHIKKMPAEDVGVQAASMLLGEIERGGVVDSTHQGLLFLLCALCPPDVSMSKDRVAMLAPYAIETLRQIRDFLGVRFVIKPDPSTTTVILKCVGCGLKNLSMKIS